MCARYHNTKLVCPSGDYCTRCGANGHFDNECFITRELKVIVEPSLLESRAIYFNQHLYGARGYKTKPLPTPLAEVEGDKNLFIKVNTVKITYNGDVREIVGEVMIMNRFYHVVYHKL